MPCNYISLVTTLFLYFTNFYLYHFLTIIHFLLWDARFYLSKYLFLVFIYPSASVTVPLSIHPFKKLCKSKYKKWNQFRLYKSKNEKKNRISSATEYTNMITLP